jgi:hypothetical protein
MKKRIDFIKNKMNKMKRINNIKINICIKVNIKIKIKIRINML